MNNQFNRVNYRGVFTTVKKKAGMPLGPKGSDCGRDSDADEVHLAAKSVNPRFFGASRLQTRRQWIRAHFSLDIGLIRDNVHESIAE